MRKCFLILMFLGTLCYSAYSQNVALTLKTTKGDKIQYVDANITHLEYIKDYTTRIEGLSQLKSLQSIQFDMMGFMHDFSFLRDAPWLTKVVIRGRYDMHTDLSFVKHLPNLRVLLLGEGGIDKEIHLDLCKNTKLEFLEFQYANLEHFPELKNIPETLRYLNLYGNKIQSLPEDFSRYSHIRIFMGMNPYKERKYDNILYDEPEDVLDEEYLPY